VFTTRVAKAGSQFVSLLLRGGASMQVGQSPSMSRMAAAPSCAGGAGSASVEAPGPLVGPHASLDVPAAASKLSSQGMKNSGQMGNKLLPPLPAHLVGCDPKAIRWIEILVCDQGVGIPPEKQAKLFQAFSQIDAQALQQGQGSGLGLVFAQQIIELHGGKVVFRSEVGQGSVFGFCIPFRVMTAEQVTYCIAVALPLVSCRFS